MKHFSFLIISIFLTACGGGNSTDDSGKSDPNDNTNIYILGDSTVHNAYVSNDGRKLAGWGEFLGTYMKHPENAVNRARAGSTSVSYLHPPTGHNKELFGVDRHWEDTKQRIINRNNKEGGFLLIQFGSNDQFDKNITSKIFQKQLEQYINEAKEESLNLTPVLISPPNHRNHHNSRHFAKYIKPIAKENNVLFLDLHKRSRDEWAKYKEGPAPNPQETLPEADKIFAYEAYDGVAINNAHFSPKGAKIVAGWIKELACKSKREDGKSLCRQFK